MRASVNASFFPVKIIPRLVYLLKVKSVADELDFRISRSITENSAV
jgi:hypothetical protein